MDKFCMYCGKELLPEAKHCPNCGKEIIKKEEIKKEEIKNEEFISKTNINIPNNNINNSVKKENNGIAIAGFIISIVSSTFCCGTLSWLSLIFSIVGLSESKKKDGSGKELAIAGIIISAIMLLVLISIIALGYSTSFIENLENNSNMSFGEFS